MICLSVSSVGLAKILNMSNKAGQPSNTSFVNRSKRQNLSVSSSNKLLTTVQRKDKKLIWSCRYILFIGRQAFPSCRHGLSAL